MPQEIHLFVDHEELRLTADGRWLSNGEEITHTETTRAFSRGIEREEGGSGWRIRSGPETKAVVVEDTAFFVTGLEGSPESGFTLALSNGGRPRLDPTTLRYRPPGNLQCRVPVQGSPGDRQESARFLRGPHAELLFHARETAAGLELEIQGKTVLLAGKSGN